MRDLDWSDVEADAERMADGWTVFYSANGVTHTVSPTGLCATCGRSHRCPVAHVGSECGGYHCANCGARSGAPFECKCGAGRADHVLAIES